MKRLISISLIGAMFAAASLAQPSDTWLEQWFKAKYGRNSPMEEAHQRAERANAVIPETAMRTEATPLTSSWREQWFKAKFGRYSPAEEARQAAEQANAAFCGDSIPKPPAQAESTMPVNSWREQWFKAKFGRYSPMEEARQRAERQR